MTLPAQATGGTAPGPTDPALPVAIALALLPAACVLQYRVAAPAAALALLLAVLLHRRGRGEWPWSGGWGLAAALGLFLWGALSAPWALAPGRAFGTSLQLLGFVALGAAGMAAVGAATPAAKRRLLGWAAGGLVAGLALAAADALSGNAIRAAVRGLREFDFTLAFGLKPAASAMALWLPLAAAAPWPRPARLALLGLGGAVILALPGETPKLAVLAAAAAGLLAWRLPRLVPRLLGAGLAAAILLMPLALGPVLARGVEAGQWPPSAAHRLLIWDFSIARIAEHPLVGWGMDSARAMPGGQQAPPAALLARFGLDGPGAGWIPGSQLLPLHPHNMALQLWLELGLPGALLGAVLALALGLGAARSARPALATAVLASAAVTAMLSFGAWQEWWIGAQLLALAAVAALPPRKGPAAPP